MRQILMTLAFWTIASTAQANSQLTPWVFDLQDQFTTCITSPADDPYANCQIKLVAAYTLRREIGLALDSCRTSNTAGNTAGNTAANTTANSKGCATAFTAAGLPVAPLNRATQTGCFMLGNIFEIDISYMPENACITQIAEIVEQNSTPTTHNTRISCGSNYVECLEIVSLSRKYWQNAVIIQHLDQLHTVPNLTDDPNTSHRIYSLLEQQHRLKTELAKTTCQLQTVMPHRANTRDYAVCLGRAFADIWLAPKTTYRD